MAEESQDCCVFCAIASGQDKYTEIILQDDKLVCFRDIFPAAPHHYLVIPREHIVSCLSLDKKHVGLVEGMADMAKCALRQQGITDMKDISGPVVGPIYLSLQMKELGFHQPPYTSVDHLHLHVLAPASQIFVYMEYKFLLNTQRFIEEQCLLERLKGGLSGSLEYEVDTGSCAIYPLVTWKLPPPQRRTDDMATSAVRGLQRQEEADSLQNSTSSN